METTECPYLLAVIPNALIWWMKRRLRTCKYAVVFQHGVTIETGHIMNIQMSSIGGTG